MNDQKPTEDPKVRAAEKVTLIQLLPNVLTVVAICAGLTAIRFGLQGSYELAVQLILLAAVLDGLDGRLARALKSESGMGAELDSLADFLNFGVAPGMLLYTWALEDSRSFGWIAVLVFAVCAVVRLARFNVMRKSEDKDHDNAYFTGVPSPAGRFWRCCPCISASGSVPGRCSPICCWRAGWCWPGWR